MKGKKVDLGSQDVLKNAMALANTGVLDATSGPLAKGQDLKEKQALEDTRELSDSEHSGSSSPAGTPSPRSPNQPTKTEPQANAQSQPSKSDTKTIPQSNIGYHNDLLVLRSALASVSQEHYDAFWAENGPMWEALHGQFRVKELFATLPQETVAKIDSDSTNQNLIEVRDGNIDDFSLLNRAYGLLNTSNTSDDTTTGYRQYNNIIEATLEKLRSSSHFNISNQFSEFYRWNAMYRLTIELNSYNQSIQPESKGLQGSNTAESEKFQPLETECNPYQSITDIYTVLENIRSPLNMLRRQFNYQGILTSISSFYETSQDRIYQYLFFSVHFKRTQILDLIKSLIPISQKLTPQEKSLKKSLEKFQSGLTNETTFKAELRALSVQYNWYELNTKLLEIDAMPDNQKALADLLEIQLPKNGLSYTEFLKQVEIKANPQSNLPLHKRNVAMQVTRFAKGELTHTQFLGQLKIISMNFRPNGFWTRLGHYLGALIVSIATLDFNFTRFSTLKTQYDDIYHLNKSIRKNYKESAAKRDSDLAILSVNDVLPMTENGIKNQEDTKVTGVLWLNEQEKARCESLKTEFSPLTQLNTQNTNPHYATALAKLHFISSQRLALEQQTRKLEPQITETIQEHQKIKTSDKKSSPRELPKTRETQKSLVSAITLGFGLQRNAKVCSYVVETLAHEPKSSLAVR